jgi:hypothetical protein
MSRHARKTEIHRRRVRHTKLISLRKRYAAAKTDSQRSQIMEKTRRVSPSLTPGYFTGTAESEPKT